MRKPQAFRHSVFREDLFPRTAFRRPGRCSTAARSPKACRVYVGLLHLAATQACEAQFADHLESLLAAGAIPDLDRARDHRGPGR